MGRLLEFYRGLPRSGKWLVWAAVLLVAYFGVVEPALDATARLVVRGDQLARRLDAARDDAGERGAQLAAVQLGASRFGDVALPGDPNLRPADLDARIDEILDARGVASHTVRSSAGRLSEGPLTRALGQDARVQTIGRDVTFTASPEVVTAVLADLERAPEVARITRVDLSPADDRASRSVQTAIALEAWASPSARRSGQ